MYGEAEVEVHTVLTPHDKHSSTTAQGSKLTLRYACCTNVTLFLSVPVRTDPLRELSAAFDHFL